MLKRYTYEIASTEFSAKIELQSESDGYKYATPMCGGTMGTVKSSGADVEKRCYCSC